MAGVIGNFKSLDELPKSFLIYRRWKFIFSIVLFLVCIDILNSYSVEIAHRCVVERHYRIIIEAIVLDSANQFNELAVVMNDKKPHPLSGTRLLFLLQMN